MSYWEDHLKRQREEHERFDASLHAMRVKNYTPEQKAAIVRRFFQHWRRK